MTKIISITLRTSVWLLASAILASCSGSDGGGASGTDGSLGGSPAESGGTIQAPPSTTAGSGGSGQPSGGSGGIEQVAGSGGRGGASLTGGSPEKGGTTTMGGASGGASDAGGVSAAGGTSTGGSRATGGSLSPGGSTAVGGSKLAGGSSASGGSVATGGTSAAGGTATTGGTKSTGGSSGGSKPSAGATAGTMSGGAAAGGTVTGGTTSTGGATGGGGSTHTGVWKVMMLGNSITGSTCYPQVLSSQLIAGNHVNFQFVGTVTNNQSCGANTPSVKTEGHGGYGVTYLPSTSTRPQCTKQPQGCGSYAELQTWAAEPCDIVLMHFATNDIWDGRATSEILSSFVAVIAEFRKNNPNVIFFVSKIIKLDPSGCTSCLTNVAALAAALTPAWASTNSTPSSPVYIIDHYDCGFDPTDIPTETADGVHPTLVGATKMATTSYNALVAAGYF
ncbi:MAG: hypothetical protein WCG85_23585 [Polyangia bacterium]